MEVEELMRLVSNGKINLSGSQINFGGYNVMNNYAGQREKAPSKSTEKTNEPIGVIPSELRNEKAGKILKALQEKHIIDDNFQPIGLSWTKKSVLAYQIAVKVGIDNQWKVFGELWGLNPDTLRAKHNEAMGIKSMGDFYDIIDPVITLSTGK